MKILVTGGAGYIGSLLLKRLIDQNYQVICFDNLSNSTKDYIDKQAETIIGDLMDIHKLEKTFQKYTPEIVIHCAAYKDSMKSEKDPIKYSQNIYGTLNLLNTIHQYPIKQFIYSSSAAVYGNPKYLPIDEQHPTEPTNFYGFTKLECEHLIQQYSQKCKFPYIIFRYFNVIGNSEIQYPWNKFNNVISKILETLYTPQKIFEIYGNKFETPDGTCIRDFIDINDLVSAHIAGINFPTSEIFNISTGTGISVLQLLQAFEHEISQKINIDIKTPRQGEIIQSYAEANPLKTKLHWKPKYELLASVKNILKTKGNSFYKSKI